MGKPVSQPAQSGNWVERWMAECEVRIVQQQQLLTGIRHLLTQLADMPVDERQKRDQLDRHCQRLIIHETQLSYLCTLRQRLLQRRNR